MEQPELLSFTATNGDGTQTRFIPEQQVNAVYTERNMCVSLIARMALKLGYNAGKVVGPCAFCDATEEWNVIFIDLPSGQISWHVHESEMLLFDFLPLYEKRYDGHTQKEKYQRVLHPGL